MRKNRVRLCPRDLFFVGLIGGAMLLGLSSAEAREPRAGRPLVFVRGQMKYGLDGFYLRKWVDRPLLIDPALRTVPRGDYVTTPENFRRMAATVSSYGLDGFAFFPETSGRMGVFELVKTVGIEHFRLLPEFVSWRDPEPKLAMLEAALANPYCAKIDGRIPITAYRSDAIPLAEWQVFLADYRKRFGNQFIFLPDLNKQWYPLLEKAHQGTLTEEDVAPVKETLHEWLEVFDGLYFAAAAMIKKDRKFDAGFYENILIPTVMDVMGAPAGEGKYVGFSACIGHENCTRLGYTLSHDGTKTLRRSMEAALAANPDIIVIPEWDEQNENTSLRPTVYNSFSTKRIMRHYMQRLRGGHFSPIAGDNISIPNVIVSYRKILTLGEKLEVEVLHVQDRDEYEPFTVDVALRPSDGPDIHLGEGTFSAQGIEEKTFVLPSEKLARYAVLRPVIQIRRQDRVQAFMEGLHHIRLRPTWNWDYKWVKQPLRDLARDVSIDFSPVKVPSSSAEPFQINAHASSGDDLLVSVEVLDEDAVVFAPTPTGSSLRERRNSVLIAIEMRAYRRSRMVGELEISGAEPHWATPAENLPASATIRDGNLCLNELLDWRPRIVYVGLVPDQAKVAVLHTRLKALEMDLPLSRVLEQGIVSLNQNDATLTVSICHQQPDHPLLLNKQDISFVTEVVPSLNTSVFHVRGITQSGSVFRSAPIQARITDSTMVPLTVWSDSLNAPYEVLVQRSRIPSIHYEFEPARGNALTCGAGRLLWAHIGGFTDAVTKRGGDGGLDGSPYVRRNNYPKEAVDPAPKWVVDDGTPVLEFDGIGNYIAFPQGVLPRRSPFTLEMEIFPENSAKPQVLFIHHGSYIGSLTLRLEGGCLQGSFVNNKLEKAVLQNNLPVPAKMWSTIRVSYDLTKIQTAVNGEQGEPLPCRGTGIYDCVSAFGGFGGDAGKEQEFSGKTGWFKGRLRRIDITHQVR